MAKMMSISSWLDKQKEVVMFSSTAIALYGYDQGMMSLINTNYDYLAVMGLSTESAMVGVIVSIYYLGCAVGAVMASALADAKGRRLAIFVCLATASLGNLLCFIAGIGGTGGALTMMILGRIIMGLGVGGIDAVVPVYSSELSASDGRGTALAQEFQANIFGLNMAFAINLLVTHILGKSNQWAWRIPIIAMQIYPALLFAVSTRLPETPRWLVLHSKNDRAKKSLITVFGEDGAQEHLDEMIESHEEEQKNGMVSYSDMLYPSGQQFHPTTVTVMGQVNQALTGYGAVSVYGPQIFELLGFGVTTAEYITMGNYVCYLAMMTFAWLLIDRVGRRWLMVHGSWLLALSFLLLTILGGLAMNNVSLSIPSLSVGIPGTVILFLATSTFGIAWLVPPWLIPTEIYPSTARAQGSAVSVVVWGLANFAVTLLTPIGFNNFRYWLFLVFAVTNAFAGWWTWTYSPESGGRSFEENQDFFKEAAEHDTWAVRKILDGAWLHMPNQQQEEEEGQGGNGKKKADGEQGQSGGVVKTNGSNNDDNLNESNGNDVDDERRPLLSSQPQDP